MNHSLGRDHILDMSNPLSDPKFKEEYMKRKEQDQYSQYKSYLTPSMPIKPWLITKQQK
jgi:hypothetical protein